MTLLAKVGLTTACLALGAVTAITGCTVAARRRDCPPGAAAPPPAVANEMWIKGFPLMSVPPPPADPRGRG